MDWNWFFSSLSQSSAAIVGIFGAFIITKVLSNQAVFDVKLERGKSLQATADKLVASAHNLAFSWYVKHQFEDEMESVAELLEKDEEVSPDDIYATLNFPSFMRRSEVIEKLTAFKKARALAKERQRAIDEERARARAERQKTSRQLSAVFDSLNEVRRPFVPNFSPPTLGLDKERESIDGLEVEIRHHIRTISDYLGTVTKNPESSPAITGALSMVAALFLLGVIYPLSFMPTPTNWTPALELQGFWSRVFSLRGLLLTSVAALFLAALVMFALLNSKLKYKPELLESLQKFTTIGAYSEFYGIAEENAKEKRAAALKRQAKQP